MRIGGKIEVFTPRAIKGWIAVYGDDRDERLQLEVLLDGDLIATTTAEEYRADIALQGYGDGRCQFQIILPKALKEEEMRGLRLRVKKSEVFLELPRSILLRENTLIPALSRDLASPVFIVGSPRSGTSVLTRALTGIGYHGFAEGNFLGLSQAVEQRIDEYLANYDIDIPDVLLGNVELIDLKSRLFSVFKEILDKYNPQEPWFDKTGNPEAILGMPRFMKAWPNSRVIFAKRHGIENVSSRLTKFPDRDFNYHCQDWASNMRAWRMTRGQLDPGRITEVDQRELLETPDLVAAKLAALLGVSQDKQRSMERVIQTERPQESYPGSAEKKARIHNIGWTIDQIETFEKLCSEEMSLFGYHDL